VNRILNNSTKVIIFSLEKWPKKMFLIMQSPNTCILMKLLKIIQGSIILDQIRSKKQEYFDKILSHKQVNMKRVILSSNKVMKASRKLSLKLKKKRGRRIKGQKRKRKSLKRLKNYQLYKIFTICLPF
jgi:hypothetical protein